MLDILKNPNHWRATKSREDRYTFSVEAFSLNRLTACPDCGAPLAPLDPNGTKSRYLIDAPSSRSRGSSRV